MAKKGKISNIVVWVILGLLIVGLAGFGTGNFGGTVRNVATVGETEIALNTYGRALRQEMTAQGNARGTPLTLPEAQAAGLDTRVLQSLLATAALEEAARDAGLSVGDALVSQQVLTIPGFQGLDGSFDREAYRFALDQAGLSVTEFEDSVRAELARNLLQAAAVGGVTPLPAYSEAIYTYLGEALSVTFATLGEGDLDAPVPAPTDAQAQAYYDANADAFLRPGFKAITYAWLTPDMILDTIEVSDADLRAAFDTRTEDFNVPAQRLVERLGFPDDAAATAALEAITAGGTDFDTLLADRDLTIDDVDLGFVTQADLGEAGDGVFGLEDTGVVGPLASPIGPALFRVNAILNARTTSFEDARDTLRADIARTRADGVIASEIEPLDDLLAGGATLEDIAAESEMELGSLDWRGPAPGIASYAAFDSAAIAVQEGDFPEIIVAEDGSIFALRLDDTVPAQVAPFDEIAEDVTEATRNAAIRDALTVRADDIVIQLQNGASFEDLALASTTRSGITRGSAVEGIPAGSVAGLFDLNEGNATLLEDTASITVLRLDAVTTPDQNAPEAQALRTALDQQAAQAMAQDILSTLARAVEAEAGISINQAALNAVHSQMQ